MFEIILMGIYVVILVSVMIEFNVKCKKCFTIQTFSIIGFLFGRTCRYCREAERRLMEESEMIKNKKEKEKDKEEVLKRMKKLRRKEYDG